MKTYAEKLKDPRWQKKRLAVMQRDDFACRDCGSKIKTLHVHHCHYRKGEPWKTEAELMLTLCEDCHDLRHQIEGEIKELLGRILARLENDTSHPSPPLEALRNSLRKSAESELSPLVIERDLVCDLADAVIYKRNLDDAHTVLSKMASAASQ